MRLAHCTNDRAKQVFLQHAPSRAIMRHLGLTACLIVSLFFVSFSISSRKLMPIILASIVSVIFRISWGWLLFPDVYHLMACPVILWLFHLIMYSTYTYLLFLIVFETVCYMLISLISLLVLNSFPCTQSIFLKHLLLNASNLFSISLVVLQLSRAYMKMATTFELYI